MRPRLGEVESRPVHDAPARILLIDDDEHFVRVLDRFLREHGFEVTSANSGEGGIHAAAAHAPDLVLCDLDMPGLDGYAVLARLQADARLAAISVVFLTGQSAPEQIRAGMNLGADDYLTKPVDPDELLRAVKARLMRARQRRVATPAAPSDVRLEFDDTFLVKTMSEKKLIKVRDVKSVIAYGEYSWVYWDKGKGALLRKPLKQWEAELPDNQFVRIHRHAIINLAFMERVEKLSSGRLQVFLRDTAGPIAVSLRLAPALNRKLEAFKS